MKEKVHRMYLKVLSIFVVVGIMLLGSIQIKAATVSPTPTPEPPWTQSDFYLEHNGEMIPNGKEIDMPMDIHHIMATTKRGFPSGTTIKWTSTNTSVIELEDTDAPVVGNGMQVKLVRKSPGYSTVSAIITMPDGTIFSLSCHIKVALQVDDSGPMFSEAQTTKNKIIILNNDGVTTDSIPLKYVLGGGAVAPNLVEWESSNERVVTVDKGKLTPIGSGKARITIYSNTRSISGERQENYVDVVVRPLGRADKTNPDAFKQNFTYKTEGSNFQIESNAKRATDLTWNITDSKGKVISPSDKSLLSYEADSISGKLYVTNAKAGTYYITAYADKAYGEEIWNKFVAKVIVPIDINEGPIVMNVDDTYNIVENSNIPNVAVYEYRSEDKSIAEVNNATSVITAISTGDTFINLTYIPSTDLYSSQDIIDYDLKVNKRIKVTVIDGISISPNSSIIYVGGTVTLDVKTSDYSVPIQWSSRDEKIAKVDRGVVTGVSRGKTTITATQVIGGITKRATCEITVQETITGIKIQPSEAILNIGETIVLTADVTPKALENLPLRWISTNEDIVVVESSDKQRASIKGVAGGRAVIIAVNPDNVVIGSCEVTVKQKVTSIVLNETELTVLQNQRNIQLRATVLPDNANNKKVKWKSTNTRIATVNEDTGMVTLVGSGTVAIIATSDDDPSITAICNINVGIPVTSITLDETNKTMSVGESGRIGYIITPTNATNKGVTWSSTNTSVVTVDGTGLVSARAEGMAIIMVKTIDGSIIRTCTITVMEKGTGVKLDVSDVEISVGQVYPMPYSIIPATAKDITITWESTDTKVAAVDAEGKVTGVSSGKAVIIAKPSVGTAMYANVTVVQHANDMKLNFEEKTIVIGEGFKLKATLIPSDSTLKNVTWTSSNAKVARVNQAGDVTGLQGGTAIITGKTEDGKLTAFCIVHVVERVTSIKLNTTSYRLGLNKTYTLKATVESNAATNPKVTWESSDPTIATVDSKGKVTGRKLGTVTITAKANDGSNVEASASIRVVRLVTSITLNRSTVTTIVGRTVSLKATIKPDNATYKTAKWSSSDEDIAIVDNKGNVTALKEGKVTITAEANDSSKKSASAYVIVQPRVPATSVTIINQNLTMVVGETTTLQKAINPIASNDRFTWETDNKTVATVDASTGKVTARAPGIASITVMTESGRTATTKVTVVGLNTTRLTLEQYSTYTLSVIGMNSGINWDVADSKIATVRNGRVSTSGVGTTTITATVNGRKLNCTLTVTKVIRNNR